MAVDSLNVAGKSFSVVKCHIWTGQADQRPPVAFELVLEPLRTFLEQASFTTFESANVGSQILKDVPFPILLVSEMHDCPAGAQLIQSC